MSPEQAFSGMDPDKVLSLAQRCAGAAVLVRDAASNVNSNLALVHPGEPAPYLTALNDFALWLEQSALDLTRRATAISTIQAVDRLPLINLPDVIPLPAHRFPSAAAAQKKADDLLKKYKPAKVIEDPGQLEKLSREVAKYATDPDFAAAFMKGFGAKNLVEVPRTLQAWELQGSLSESPHHEHYRRNRKFMDEEPEDVEGILYAFSAVLATATRSAEASTKAELKKVAKDKDDVALSWLMAPGDLVFGTEFLLAAFQNGVVNRIVEDNLNANNPYYRESHQLGGKRGGGLPTDPKLKILEALSRNSEAALKATEKRYTPPVELRRSGGSGAEDFKVETAFDLLFHHGTYDDKAAALGFTMEAANRHLHQLADEAEGVGDLTEARKNRNHANARTLALVEEVTRGRGEIDAAVGGLAAIIARHHVDDLHRAATQLRTNESYGEEEGAAGHLGVDSIRLSKPQLEALLVAINSDKRSQAGFWEAVARHQAAVIERGTATGAAWNVDWVIEIAAFDALALNAFARQKRVKHDVVVARNQQMMNVFDTIVSFIPGGKIKDFVASPVIDGGKLVKSQLWPEPSWDDAIADVNVFKDESVKSIQAMVVAALCESGRLGPPVDLLADMERVAVANTIVSEVDGSERVPRFWQPSPTGFVLVPYGQMDPHQQDALMAWINGPVRANPQARDALTVAVADFEWRKDDQDKG